MHFKDRFDYDYIKIIRILNLASAISSIILSILLINARLLLFPFLALLLSAYKIYRFKRFYTFKNFGQPSNASRDTIYYDYFFSDISQYRKISIGFHSIYFIFVYFFQKKKLEINSINNCFWLQMIVIVLEYILPILFAMAMNKKYLVF